MPFFSDLFSRVGRVARGQANQGVDALEDATFEATVNQTVADMKDELNKVIRASAVAMSNYNRLDAEYQKYVRQAQEWKDRAGQALDAGNEDLAKKALAKKGECDRQVASMQQAVDGAQATSEKLKQQVTELKRKIDEGERTATTLVARKNAAAAQRKVSEAMAGVGNADNAFSALGKFEESVAREEATAKAYDQLASTGKEDQDLEAQFAQLGNHGVDAELEALKKERQGIKAPQAQPPYIPKELPGPSDSIGGSQSVGDKAKA
ncbi:MAG TPA: PspA/IM30 family protein [Candidatus Limnocylindrales bacterium]|nr:PspA/IM30 family protein [Candidatus Limnocylindrales bacterium]